MIVKVHEIRDGSRRTVVAICDENLLGKKFETKDLCLDLSSDFYKGEPRTDEAAEKIIKAAYIANFAGKKSVALGIKLGVISKVKIIKIKSIPHAQVML